MAGEPDETEDRDVVFRAHFDRMQRRFLVTLVSDEIIEEHRRKPQGQHSEPLERLLHYFRDQPLAGRLAVLRERETGSFRIVALSGVRGVAPRPVGEQRFATVEEAYHGIFMKRIEELMEDSLG